MQYLYTNNSLRTQKYKMQTEELFFGAYVVVVMVHKEYKLNQSGNKKEFLE